MNMHQIHPNLKLLIIKYVIFVNSWKLLTSFKVIYFLLFGFNNINLDSLTVRYGQIVFSRYTYQTIKRLNKFSWPLKTFIELQFVFPNNCEMICSHSILLLPGNQLGLTIISRLELKGAMTMTSSC